uniref:Uncharacterized protein n=1 Tax=Anguilla anguilla TaxID=7936 RepID=A0A0E9SD50_ANGAN
MAYQRPPPTISYTFLHAASSCLCLCRRAAQDRIKLGNPTWQLRGSPPLWNYRMWN